MKTTVLLTALAILFGLGLMASPLFAETLPPTGSISINYGYDTTPSRDITLYLTEYYYENSTVTMQFSDDDLETWSNPEVFSANRQWTLPNTDHSTYIVYVRYANGIGGDDIYALIDYYYYEGYIYGDFAPSLYALVDYAFSSGDAQAWQDALIATEVAAGQEDGGIVPDCADALEEVFFDMIINCTDYSASIDLDITPAKLVFDTQPGNTTAGGTMSEFTVRVLDPSGNPVEDQADDIYITIVGNGTTLTNLDYSTPVAAQQVNDGTATFNNNVKVGNNAGLGKTITASADGLQSATSDPFAVTANDVGIVSYEVKTNNTSVGLGDGETGTITGKDDIDGTGNTVFGLTSHRHIRLTYDTEDSVAVEFGASLYEYSGGTINFTFLVNSGTRGDEFTITATDDYGTYQHGTSNSIRVTYHVLSNGGKIIIDHDTPFLFDAERLSDGGASVTVNGYMTWDDSKVTVNNPTIGVVGYELDDQIEIVDVTGGDTFLDHESTSINDKPYLLVYLSSDGTPDAPPNPAYTITVKVKNSYAVGTKIITMLKPQMMLDGSDYEDRGFVNNETEIVPVEFRFRNVSDYDSSHHTFGTGHTPNGNDLARTLPLVIGEKYDSQIMPYFGEPVDAKEMVKSVVDYASGNLNIDVAVTHIQPTNDLETNLVLYYNSLDTLSGPLGSNWTHTFNQSLTYNEDNNTIAWRRADGQQYYFEDFDNEVDVNSNPIYKSLIQYGAYAKITIEDNPGEETDYYLLTRKDGSSDKSVGNVV